MSYTNKVRASSSREVCPTQIKLGLAPPGRCVLHNIRIKLGLAPPGRCVLHNIRIKLGLAPPGRCVLHK